MEIEVKLIRSDVASYLLTYMAPNTTIDIMDEHMAIMTDEDGEQHKVHVPGSVYIHQRLCAPTDEFQTYTAKLDTIKPNEERVYILTESRVVDNQLVECGQATPFKMIVKNPLGFNNKPVTIEMKEI